MLKHLYIKNFALIDVLDIDFFSGFSVITGETGAGKSIILGAIGLLLGQRTDTKSIKADSQKCTIEATFDTNGQNIKEWLTENDLECDDDDCIIRREITASGKSRGFINDTPVTLNQMKELGEMLLDVHSQHKNLLLQKEDFQQGVLDIIADNSTLLTEYKQAYAQYKKLDAELEQLRHSVEESKEKEDFMRFQLTELTNANLTPGEQEELEQEQQVASHTEEIKSLMFDADALLNNDDNGIVSALHQACQRITNAADINPKILPLAERLNSALIDIKDMYQLYAYGQKYHLGDSYFLDIIPKLVLVYPYTESFQAELKPFVYEEIKAKYGLKLVVYPFNLADEGNHGDSYKRQIGEIMALAANPEKKPVSAQKKQIEVREEENEFLTDDYKINAENRYMLVGYCRSKEHLDWVLKNKLYNVRLGNRRGALRGMDLQIIPSRIVLYTGESNGSGKNEIFVFTVNQSEVLIADKQKMEALAYPAGKNGIGESYKLFSLGEEIKNHKKIDIQKLKLDSGRSEKSYKPLFVRY